MKILIVATSNSIHTARWIGQISDQGWEIYLFPTFDNSQIHPQIQATVTMCIPFLSFSKALQKIKLERYFRFFYRMLVLFYSKKNPNYYAHRLAKYIRNIQPDILHSLETQGSGYLVTEAKACFGQSEVFPTWWHSLWGSDIYLYERLAKHKPRIENVLQQCDFYSADCFRDQVLLNKYGAPEKLLPLDHATCGFDLSLCEKILAENNLPTAKRKLIMLKGYQGWSGRSQVAIRALTRAKDVLSGYTLVVYSNVDLIDLQIGLELFTNETGIPVVCIPDNSPHELLLAYHSKARISIGVGISDGVPNSLLEAMVMGSFPIQSFTSAADEWIKDGVTGLLVPPEDPDIIELAIRKALLDDEMVNSASAVNYQTIAQRAGYQQLKQKAIKAYQTVLETKKESQIK